MPCVETTHKTALFDEDCLHSCMTCNNAGMETFHLACFRICCTLDVLISISHAHCFADFHGGSVNCSAPQQKRWDSLLCKASWIFACAHHALYHRPQICH
jgi:hypothetical protein